MGDAPAWFPVWFYWFIAIFMSSLTIGLWVCLYLVCSLWRENKGK